MAEKITKQIEVCSECKEEYLVCLDCAEPIFDKEFICKEDDYGQCHYHNECKNKEKV